MIRYCRVPATGECMADVAFEIKTSNGLAVRDAAVLVAYPDGRYLTGQTDADGKCWLNLYRTDQEMKLIVAAEDQLPFHRTIVSGKKEVVPVKLDPSTDDRKALLFTRSTGYIPGIATRLNPHKGGYIYGDNISINGCLAHPAAHFSVGQKLHLIDVFGMETTIRFLEVEGQCSLIEYTEPKAYAED